MAHAEVVRRVPVVAARSFPVPPSFPIKSKRNKELEERDVRSVARKQKALFEHGQCSGAATACEGLRSYWNGSVIGLLRLRRY